MAISLGVFSSFLPGETIPLPETLAAVSKSATETNKREPRGIMKPRRVSPEMQAFLGGVSEISRTQALKEIWAYIKQHDLQVIICDENLENIFGGRDGVGFL
ncbi:protein TRI1-like [Olea europaea var. sylvestris]|uniref:protein TRI1-like n=1 Tax=Olea europaea var. sylvestris TaxID=158386 RepID=UPI000C1D186F|nr:protein TRI1-like [Olea europaea var. sylvestris]